MSKKPLVLIECVVLAALVAATVAPTVVAAATVEWPVRVDCTGTGQSCTPSYTFTIRIEDPSTALLTVALSGDPTLRACSFMELTPRVDGYDLSTQRLGRNEPFEPPIKPVDQVLWNLGRFEEGEHEIQLAATGVVGGCNTGTLHAWGARIELRTKVFPTNADGD